LHEYRPPFNPSEVVEQIVKLIRMYRCDKITGDHYSAGWVVESFAKHDVRYIQSDRDRSAGYLDCLPLFSGGQARLLDNRKMINQFAGLERRTFPTGRDRVDHPANQHDDLSNSTAIALSLAAQWPLVQPMPFVVPFYTGSRRTFGGESESPPDYVLADDRPSGFSIKTH
jgi:hypothetical protein